MNRQDDAPRKRRKTDSGALNVPETNWIEFERDVQIFEIQHVQGNGKFAYGFVEGPLVKALRTGQWYVFVVKMPAVAHVFLGYCWMKLI